MDMETTTLLQWLTQYGIGIAVLLFFVRYLISYVEKNDKRNTELFERMFSRDEKNHEMQAKLCSSIEKMSERIDRLWNSVKCINYNPSKGE